MKRGTLSRIARRLAMDKSYVSKVARGLVQPRTRKGHATLERVMLALDRERRVAWLFVEGR